MKKLATLLFLSLMLPASSVADPPRVCNTTVPVNMGSYSYQDLAGWTHPSDLRSALLSRSPNLGVGLTPPVRDLMTLAGDPNVGSYYNGVTDIVHNDVTVGGYPVNRVAVGYGNRGYQVFDASPLPGNRGSFVIATNYEYRPALVLSSSPYEGVFIDELHVPYFPFTAESSSILSAQARANLFGAIASVIDQPGCSPTGQQEAGPVQALLDVVGAVLAEVVGEIMDAIPESCAPGGVWDGKECRYPNDTIRTCPDGTVVPKGQPCPRDRDRPGEGTDSNPLGTVGCQFERYLYREYSEAGYYNPAPIGAVYMCRGGGSDYRQILWY